MASMKQPCVYIPHGGGPWPFMSDDINPGYASLNEYLQSLPGSLPVAPTSIIVVSAHWEANVATLMTCAQPPLLYDYYGFPAHTYELEWPSPGISEQMSARIQRLFADADIPIATDDKRGYDHGVFVPLKVMYPNNPRIPTTQLSLHSSLDPAMHLRIGRALAPLRDEGVLIIGSGMSYHNMRGFGSADGAMHAERFDKWLMDTVTLADTAERDRRLIAWERAPSARESHPREEHLLPLMVVVGAAHSEDRGTIAFNDTVLGTRVSAIHF